MSLKFKKHREVTVSYAKIPIYYIWIGSKQLAIMDRQGKNYTACWRSQKTDKLGIEFLIPATGNGFIFKDKEYKLSDCSRIW